MNEKFLIWITGFFFFIGVLSWVKTEAKGGQKLTAIVFLSAIWPITFIVALGAGLGRTLRK